METDSTTMHLARDFCSVYCLSHMRCFKVTSTKSSPKTCPKRKGFGEMYTNKITGNSEEGVHRKSLLLLQVHFTTTGQERMAPEPVTFGYSPKRQGTLESWLCSVVFCFMQNEVVTSGPAQEFSSLNIL